MWNAILIAQEVTNSESFLDRVIAALIILLILSLINEKVVDLIRSYSKMPASINRFNWLKNINKTHTSDPEIDKEKSREISLLAVIIGIVIALLSKASLFDLLKDGAKDNLFWSSDETVNGPLAWFIVGIMLTGFFLSFGSRFFHDLLDVLYQTKEYKRKLKGKHLYEGHDINEVQDYIDTTDVKLVKKALARHGKELKRKYADTILTMELGNTVNDQIGIIVTVRKLPPADFPKDVPVSMPNGRVIKVAVETIIKKTGSIHYGLHFRLQNPGEKGYTGALGGILVSSDEEDKKYLLTCSHVALGGRGDDLGGYFDTDLTHIETDILDNETQTGKGTLVYAKVDPTNDTALVALTDLDTSEWNNELPTGGHYEESIPVSMLTFNERIRFYSSKRNMTVEGVVNRLRVSEKVSLEYNDLSINDFEGVIAVGNNDGGFWSPISQKGDSGAVLYDEDNAPFGMIIGGDDEFTYALPLTDILNSTRMKVFVDQPFIV